jgi:NADH dehydrogenase
MPELEFRAMPLVTLFGGSGFVGRHAVQQFARAGWRVRVAVRRPHLALELRVYGAVGQVEPVQANIRDDASVLRAVAGADCVVNLVGLLTESAKQTFEAVHADGSARIARAAKNAGVRHFVQVSAIGASETALSDYGRTKARGEAAVRAVFPNAVILRPSIIFGPRDQFFNRFAQIARFSAVIPIVGGTTRFQPVFVDDVAQAIVTAASAEDPAVYGQTFELGGPDIACFKALMHLMLRIIKRRRGVIDTPFWIARLQASALSIGAGLLLQSNHILTRDQIKSLATDNVVGEGALGLSDLGIAPTSMEAILPSYLWRFRPRGQYDGSI